MQRDYSGVITKIDSIAAKVYADLEKAEIPALQLSTRTKANIRFDDDLNVWKYGKNKTERAANSLDGAYMLLRTMYLVDFIKDMIKEKKSSTLRETYYISEGWNLAKFSSQNESDLLAEDLEIVTGCMREDFKLRPEEDGARVMGDITIVETDRKGKKKTINCRDDVGDSGYGIPYNVEKDKLDLVSTDAQFLIAVETGGMFDRLVENGFD